MCTNTPSLLTLATGFWISRALHVAAKLGIADLIGDTARAPEHLASLAQVHADTLGRVLRALASVGVFREEPDGRFTNTAVSEGLKTGVQGSLRPFIIMLGEIESWRAWEELEHSVRTGQPAFNQAFGSPLFEYLQRNSDVARVFDEGMQSRGAQDEEAVRQAYDFSSAREIVDLAGGRGSLLAALLRAYPEARGILFELSHVATAAEAAIAKDVRARFRIQAGDLFDDPLPSGADVYILKKVIHDWPDEEARRILHACHAAMSEQSTLLVIEPIVPLGNEPSLAKLFDLFMLVWPGGRERTESAHRELIASAGLRITRVIQTASPISIVEARTA